MKKLIDPPKDFHLLSKDGEKITFDFKEDAERENRGFTVHHITAYLNGEEAGYLKISYIPQEKWDEFMPDIYHYLSNMAGFCIGLKKGEIRENHDYKKGEQAEKFPIDSLQGKQTLIYEMQRFVHSLSDGLKEKDCFSLTEEQVAQEMINLNQITERKHGNQYRETKDFHVDKPLVDYIRVYHKDDIYFPDKRLDDTLVDKSYRGKGLGLALYKAGALWMGMNNLRLYRSGVQSEEAQSFNFNKMLKLRSEEHTMKSKREEGAKRYFFDYRGHPIVKSLKEEALQETEENKPVSPRRKMR